MYRLYIKLPTDKRFKPVDWNAGTQVGNLIYATLFTEAERDRLLAGDLADPANAHLTFEFRSVNV